MTDDASSTRAVLVRSIEKFSPAAVAAVLGRRAGVHALDYAVSLRRSWGLVASSLPAVEADALSADLTSAGQAAIAAPNSLLEELTEPILVSKADLVNDGFDLVAGPKNAVAQRYSWAQLAAVCAGAVETKTTTMVSEAASSGDAAKRVVRLGLTMVTGIPLMGGAKAEKKREISSTDRAMTLDLLFVNPTRRLRIVARSFNFGVLGAKMAHTADANFAILISELIGHAPSALRGKGTRAFLAGRPGEAFYESLGDLEGEERWLLNLAVLNAAL